MLIVCVINFSRFSSQWFQEVEHGLQRIEQIYSRLYNNEDTLGQTKLDTEMEKNFRVNMLTSFNYSGVHNLICKVNKNLVLRLRLDFMALRVLLSATVLEVSFILKELFIYFSNFANCSERKGLSAFTGKFLSSTAVFRTQVVSGRKFSCDNDRRETLVLYRRCEQYSIILSSRNKSFPRNPFEFLHIRESLVSFLWWKSC